MPTIEEILKQTKRWMVDGQFIENTAYSINDIAEMLDEDEMILGYLTARAKAPEPYASFAARWSIILTNKRLLFLSKGDGKSLYVDSIVSKWEMSLENILSVQKQKGLLTNKIIIYPDKVVIKSIPNELINPFFEAFSKAIKNACNG